MLQSFDLGKECFAVSEIDSVPDSYEDWTSVDVNFLDDDGHRPVH